MRVIFPWTIKYQEAWDSVEMWSPERVYVGDDDEAYWRLLCRLWGDAQDFILIEHDIVPINEQIQSLIDCPLAWCGNPYFLWSAWGCWHGLTRYRASLMISHPDLMTSIQHRRWGALDSAVINHLRALGHPEPHWHWPAAKHLRPSEAGWGINHFLQCANCGTALDMEDIRRSPHVPCRGCGQITEMPMPNRTATDSVW